MELHPLEQLALSEIEWQLEVMPDLHIRASLGSPHETIARKTFPANGGMGDAIDFLVRSALVSYPLSEFAKNQRHR